MTFPLIPMEQAIDLRSMTIAHWKAWTAVSFSARSVALQRLDQAMEAYLTDKYALASLNALRHAFRDWVHHKYLERGKWLSYPQDFTKPLEQQLWHADPRNARGAMTALFKVLFPPAVLSLEQGDLNSQPEVELAITYIRNSINWRAYELFKGQTVAFRMRAPAGPQVPISRAQDYLIPAAPAAVPPMGVPPAGHMPHHASPDGYRPLPIGVPQPPGPAGLAPGGITAGWRLALNLATNTTAVARGIGSAVNASPVSDSVGDTAGLVATLATKIGTALRVLTGVSNADVWNLILAAAGLPDVIALAGQFAPGLGGVINIMRGGHEIATAVMTYRAAKEVHVREEMFRDGAARTAVIGIGKMMNAEAEQARASGGRRVLAGTVALAFLGLDGGVVSGPVIGAAQALVETLLLIADYVEAWKTKEEMNAFLATLDEGTGVNVGPELFSRWPLLGAYYLLIAETSTVLAICLEQLRQPGVMREMELIIRNDLPLVLKQAARYVATSKLVVPGLLNHRLQAERRSTAAAIHGAVASPEAAVRCFGWLASIACFQRVTGTLPPPRDSRFVGYDADSFFATFGPTVTGLPTAVLDLDEPDLFEPPPPAPFALAPPGVHFASAVADYEAKEP